METSESEDTDNETYEPNKFQTIQYKKRKRDKNSPQKHHKVPKGETTSNPINTQNRFSILPTEKDIRDKNKKEIDKIPPFILYGVTELQALLGLIRATTSEFTYQLLTDDKLKIQTKSVENYKNIKKILDDNQIVRHTYKLPQEKLFRVVLRNLHYTTDISDITEALKEKGHIVKQIMNARDKQTKKPKNLFFIDLERNTNNSEVYKITNMLHAIVRFEAPYRKQTIIQCKRCQNYGHTRNQCTQQFRCVKCADFHDYRLCSKKKEDGKPAKCALCLGAHPANYKGCHVYIDIFNRRYPTKTEAANQQQTNRSTAKQPPRQKQKTDVTVQQSTSYAKMVSKQTQQTDRHNSQTQMQSADLQEQPTVNHQFQFLNFLQQQNAYLQQQNITLQQQIEKQQQSICELTQEIRKLRDEIKLNKSNK